MNFERLNESAESLYHALKENCSALENMEFGNPYDFSDINYNKPILILGLNHSSAEKGKDSILHHVPHTNDDNLPENFSKFLKDHRLCYDTYFKKNYELVKSLGYKMFWQHPDFWKKTEHKIRQRIGSKANNHENHLKWFDGKLCTPDSNYVVFNDLLPIKHKNSKLISDELFSSAVDENPDTLSRLTKSFFENLLKYHSPKIVVATNAKAALIILKILGEYDESKELKSSSSIIINGEETRIFFSGQLSGGATDSFSMIRLRNEISFYLKT